MSSLIWVGFIAFFLVALAVGVRLLLLAHRTRELPELLMGIGVLGIGPVGFGLLVGAEQAHATSPALFRVLLGAGTLALSCGAFAKFVFNWRVYHPANVRVRGLVIFAGLVLLGAFVYSGFVDGFADAMDVSAHWAIRSSLLIACLLWGSAESFAYWTKMRRRVRLGLADPVVANRFLLWAIGAAAAGTGSLIGTITQLVTGSQSTGVGWVMMSSSMHGLVAAIAIGLAFIPPAPYRRYVRGRAERSANSA